MNFSSMRAFADAHGESGGFDYDYLSRKRDRSKTFRRAMDEIKEEWSAKKLAAESQSLAHDLAPERWPDLDSWKGVWLERYRETCDRDEANRMVSRTLSEVEDAMREDPEFEVAYEIVFSEFVAKAEDAKVRLATQGKGGAEVLETQSQRLSKVRLRNRIRGNPGAVGQRAFLDYDREDTRAEARHLFRRLVSGIEPTAPRQTDDAGDEQRPALAAS